MSASLGPCDATSSGVEIAVVEVKLISGKMVLLCSHHYEKSADLLLERGAELVQDNREETLYTRV